MYFRIVLKNQHCFALLCSIFDKLNYRVFVVCTILSLSLGIYTLMFAFKFWGLNVLCEDKSGKVFIIVLCSFQPTRSIHLDCLEDFLL